MRKLLERLWTAVATPVYFSLRTGHQRSCLAGRPVRRRGTQPPWYTHPAIGFLEMNDFTRSYVLDFGSGNSTLWWARRVVPLEGDPRWHDRIRRRAPSNAVIHFVPNDLS